MTKDDEALTALLAQLDRIAKAPMTGKERELRAKAVLGANVELGKIVGATSRRDLSWNEAKASDLGIPAELWLRALQLAAVPASASVAELLDRMHRAEAIAEMLKAGYEAGVDPVRLVWSGRG